MKHQFQLFAFYSSLSLVEELEKCGIDGIIIDWERKGKELRQQLYNTQINEHFREDLKAVRKTTNAHVVCRINPQASLDENEIKEAIDFGADELLIPMVISVKEVESVFEVVKSQVKVSAMVETREAVNLVKEFNQLPITRLFVGLNDLAIDRQDKNLFKPIVDGTISKISNDTNINIGFAGLTHPDEGFPVPCRVLINEMKRYGCGFGILRRSFYRDLDKYEISEVLSSLRKELAVPFDPTIVLDDQMVKNVSILMPS